MIHIQVIFYVLLIDLLAIMSPGPDFFMVLKNSLTNSHKAGVHTSLGIAVGSFLVFTCVLLGVGVIVASNKWLLLLVKIIGAVYLSYLGLKAIFTDSRVIEPDLSVGNKSHNQELFKEFFKVGLLCNLTNPKSLLFFISLAAYAVVHGAATPLDITVMVIISAFNTAMWFIAVALVFGNVKVRNVFYKRQRVIHVVFGCILLYVVFEIIKL